MRKSVLAASTLSAAVGLALAAGAPPAWAAEPMPPIVVKNMMRAKKEHLQECFGINAVGRNDCAKGAHSCAGQATQARDPGSFVLLPAGDCAKIAGGSLTPKSA